MDTIQILLTTDNHVGFNEDDAIRGDDSAVTFLEIMQLAKKAEVDMVLQSGDLFHFNKPSKKALHEVIRTLRSTCLGDKPCSMQVLNHGLLNTDEEFNHVNYEDPNINVAIPVFGISGNHDDSGGTAMLSPMDILSATGLMNYYGRVMENDNIVVTPVLLQKGVTKLALYGISNVRDERLFRTFREGNVKFLRPSVDPEEWFNIIAVHQNHSSHTETSYLPEHFIPDFMHLIIWGHEHECLIDPVINPQQGFSVIQPGSSVATSLSEAEAVPKHVGILSVSGTRFELEKIRLKTVRPFKMATVFLSQDSNIKPGPKSKGDVTRWLIEQVDHLIEQAHRDWLETQNSATNPQELEFPLPLIRLRVEYGGGYEVENPTRFSNRFVGKVANVNDVVQYFRRKHATAGPVTKGVQATFGDVDQVNDQQSGHWTLENVKVQALVEEFLKKEGLNLLQENGLGDAVSQFVDKDDKTAVKAFVDGSLALQLQNMLNLGVANEADILRAMDNLRTVPPDQRPAPDGLQNTREYVERSAEPIAKPESGVAPSSRATATRVAGRAAARPRAAAKTTTASRGRGRGRGRGGRGGKAARPQEESEEEIESVNEIVSNGDSDANKADSPAPPAPTRRRPTRAAAKQAKSAAIISDSDEDEDSENVVVESDSGEEYSALPPDEPAPKQRGIRRRTQRGGGFSSGMAATFGRESGGTAPGTLGSGSLSQTTSAFTGQKFSHTMELDEDDGFA